MALRFPNQKHSVFISVSCMMIPVVEESKFLGILFDRKLSFIPHIKYLKAKCLKALNLLKVLSHTSWDADRTTHLKLYRSLVRSKLDYGCIIYGSARKSFFQMLDPIHNQGLRLALGAFRTSPVASLYVEADTHYTHKERNSLCNMLQDLLLTLQILLMKLHSHQIMLIYMNKNLKLLNHLASEFHHS